MEQYLPETANRFTTFQTMFLFINSFQNSELKHWNKENCQPEMIKYISDHINFRRWIHSSIWPLKAETNGNQDLQKQKQPENEKHHQFQIKSSTILWSQFLKDFDNQKRLICTLRRLKKFGGNRANLRELYIEFSLRFSMRDSSSNNGPSSPYI